MRQVPGGRFPWKKKKEGCQTRGFVDGALGRIFFKFRKNYFGSKPIIGCGLYEGNIPLKVVR